MIDYGIGVALGAIDPRLSETMRAWRNDYRVRSWCRQTGLISEYDQEKWIKAQNDDKSIRMFTVWGDGVPVGICGLTSIDLINRRAEFSLYISPNEHGRGFGYKALKTLCNFGFVELGLNSIWGESFETNPAIEMFTRLGFVKEGVRRQFYFKGGRFINAVLVSLQRSELK